MNITKAVSVFGLIGALLWSTAPAAAAAGVQSCSVKPAGSIITPAMAAQINQIESWSQEAADAEAVSWLFVPVLLYRENSLLATNPSNGQGAFQLYTYVESWRQQYAEDHGLSVSKLDSSVTPFPSSAGQTIAKADFVNQARIALQYLKAAANQVKTIGLSAPDPLTVAWAFFTYNGRHPGYYDQAARLHQRYPDSFLYPFEGSPYVYNNWDPAHTGDLYIVQSDGGRLSGNIDEKVGAFTLYFELVRQCDPASLPAAAPTADPTKRPSPFVGQTAPALPPVGKLPKPWYALAGLVGALGLACLIGPAFRRSYAWAGVWGAALFGFALLVHNDDLTLHQASYIPHRSAVTLALQAGAIITAILAVMYGARAALADSQGEQVEWLHRFYSWLKFSQRLSGVVSKFQRTSEWPSRLKVALEGCLLALVVIIYMVMAVALTVICFITLGLIEALTVLYHTKWWKMPTLVLIGLTLLYWVSSPPDPTYARYGVRIMVTLVVLSLVACLSAYLHQTQAARSQS